MHFDKSQYKQKGNILIFLLIGILVIGGLAGAYYLGTKKSSAPTVSPAPVATSPASPGEQTPQTTPSSTSNDETANWKTYILKSVGLTYKLPPGLTALGELQEFVVPGQKGTLVFISRENSKVVSDKEILMGTTSIDYEEGRGGEFIDLQGFTRENGKYYAKFVQGRTFDLSSEMVTEISNPNGLKILKIKGRNFEGGDAEGLPVAGTPGEGKIGALININKSPYQGLAVQMDLTSNLTEQLFDQILSTFKFTN